MEKNINPEINRLNMETSRNAADSLRGWAGLGSEKNLLHLLSLADQQLKCLKNRKTLIFQDNLKVTLFLVLD